MASRSPWLGEIAWWYWLALVVLTLARLWMSLSTEITPPEALHAMRAARWELVDGQGGGLALLLLKLPGTESLVSPLALRWSGPVLGLIVSMQLWWLLPRLGLPHAGWTVLLLNLLPAFNLLTTTFSPLLPAMALGLLGVGFFWKALHQAHTAYVHFALAGLAWGAATLCHASAALYLLAALLFLAASRRWRRHLLSLGGFTMLVDFFFLGCLPYFFWNQDHQHLGWPLWWEMATQPTASGILLAQASHGLSWGLLAAGFFCLVRGCTMRYLEPQHRLARLLFFGCLGLVALLLMLRWPWLCVAQLLLPALAWAMVRLFRDEVLGIPEMAQRLAMGWAGISTLLMAIPLTRSYFPTGLVATGWVTATEELAKVITELNSTHRPHRFLLTNSAETAAILARYLPEDLPLEQPSPLFPKIHLLHGPRPHSVFAFWPRYDEAAAADHFVGRRAIYLQALPPGSAIPQPPELLRSCFKTVQPLLSWEITSAAIPLQRLVAWECVDYAELRL